MMNRHYRNGWSSRAEGAAGLVAAFMLEGCVEAVILGGAATGAFVAADRRQPEIVAGDERVGLTALSRVRNRFGEQVHFNVTSYNYNVLLTGEVPDAQAKADIGKIVMQIPQVKGVVNELGDLHDDLPYIRLRL